MDTTKPKRKSGKRPKKRKYHGKKKKTSGKKNSQQISSSSLQPTSSQNVYLTFSNSLQPTILGNPQSSLKNNLPDMKVNFDEKIFPNSEIVIKQEQNDDNILYPFTEVIQQSRDCLLLEPNIIIKEEIIEAAETTLPDVTLDYFSAFLSSDKTKLSDLSVTPERILKSSKTCLGSPAGCSRVYDDNLDKYLQLLGSKLRKLDKAACLYVQNKFDDILLQAQTGKFSDNLS